MQITLDGAKKSHDNKRFMRNNVGTFDIILENVDRFVKEFPKTRIDFRINVDNANRGEYMDLHRKLCDRFKGFNIGCYPGILRANVGCENETFFTSNDHLEFSRELWQSGLHGLYPSGCHKGCCATSLTSHVIGPKGELYVCWEHVGMKDKIVGYIDDSNGSDTGLYARYKLHGHCFDDPKCLECALLPICGGGCAAKRIRNMEYGENNNLCTIYNEHSRQGLADALYEYYISKNQKPMDN